jgi:pimeloyl-ACP methyl ester carboxylesterase|tara:strand:+ start:61 stop:855 length:795 start_codon:yes stop_codon:yes gene_type:complete
MSKTSDSFKTYYKFNKYNENDPIIFIHGIGLNHEIWNDQISYFKNYNTIVYDLIGHGKTPFNRTRIDIKLFCKQLLQLVDGLNINKFHLVGFSLGSLIAREFATSYNDKLSSLTIFGTVYKRSENEKRQIINRYESMKLKKDVTKIRALQRWFTENFLKKNPEIYKKIYSMLENTNHETWLKTYKLFVQHEDDDMKIKQIIAKTLIITGEKDIGSTPRMSEEISKLILGSLCKIIKNGRHLSNIECAEDFNVTVKEFIDNSNNA